MSEYYNLDYTGAEVATDLAKVGDSDSLVEDAAADGTAYARSNGTWAESGIDQLGTVLDAIKGDETGDDLGGKLTDIAESKLLIKKALTDADVGDVGDVLRTYAEKIGAVADDRWLYMDNGVIKNFSHIHANESYGKLFDLTRKTDLEQVHHIKFMNIEYLNSMFANFTALTAVRDFSAPSAINTSLMFKSCSSLTEVSGLDFPNVTNTEYMFQSCTSLTELSSLDFPNMTITSYMFGGCTSLIKIGSFDLSSVTSFGNYLFYQCKALRYLAIRNLGKSRLISYSFSEAENWGVEDDTIPLSAGARQSLIDSLITYSHDRAAAGMSACTISLSSTTKALLTEAEIAQITAKGFTIS